MGIIICVTSAELPVTEIEDRKVLHVGTEVTEIKGILPCHYKKTLLIEGNTKTYSFINCRCLQAAHEGCWWLQRGCVFSV